MIGIEIGTLIFQTLGVNPRFISVSTRTVLNWE